MGEQKCSCLLSSLCSQKWGFPAVTEGRRERSGGGPSSDAVAEVRIFIASAAIKRKVPGPSSDFVHGTLVTWPVIIEGIVPINIQVSGLTLFSSPLKPKLSFCF